MISGTYNSLPLADNVIPPCATELSSLLACFATSGDLRTTAECSKAAKDLHACMANRPKGGKPPKSSVSLGIADHTAWDPLVLPWRLGER